MTDAPERIGASVQPMTDGWYQNISIPGGQKSFANTQYVRADIHRAIEAERDEALNQLSSMTHAVQTLEKHGETVMAERDRLRAALVECRDEIDGYIRQEYPGDHPINVRRRERDKAANPARTALGESND